MEPIQKEQQSAEARRISGKRRAAILRVASDLGRRFREEFGRTLVLLLVALGLSLVMQAPISFSAAFLSSQPSDDFDFPDFYSVVANRRPMADLEEDIVVVNIDGLDRSEIAATLNFVGMGEPRAVGIDVLFQEPHDSLIDAWLVSSIRELPNVVMTETVKRNSDGSFKVAERSFFADTIGENVSFGAATFKSKVVGGRIREFTTYFPQSADGEAIAGFATALALKSYPEAEQKLKQRNKRDELIDYPSHEIPVYNLRDLAINPNVVADKIVLVGVVSPLEDTHPTPIDDKMPGILIHAHSIATIIHGQYVNRLHTIAAWIIALLLAWVIVVEFWIFKPNYKGVVLRSTQLLFLFLALYLGYRLFVERHLVIDFAPTVLMITFALFTCELQLGIFSFAKWTKHNISIRNKLNPQQNEVYH